jgi:formate dehydrogenase subunit gamma
MSETIRAGSSHPAAPRTSRGRLPGDVPPDTVLDDGRIVRYSFNERVMHWIAGVSYVYLLLTGLAFWSPWLFWLAALVGGGTIARELHPWAGVVFQLAVVWMYLAWSGQMHSTERDREWRHELGHYVRNEDDQLPPEGRYNAGQKMLFWAFVWLSLLLTASGLVLWWTDAVPAQWQLLRLVAVIVHPICALLTIGLFMIHIYMGIAIERGALRSMTRGDVSAAWARRHHRLWCDEVTGTSARYE